MMRNAVWGLLLVPVGLFLSGCATDPSASETTTQSSTAPVPGEQTGEGAVAPGVGPGGAGANVRF